jgi:uncharacterized membrane protein YoaK (UPF0700 family)
LSQAQEKNAGQLATPHGRTKEFVALVLSFGAGVVDIVGALTVYDLFTAHVTGTTVRLGQRLFEHNWGAATAAITIVAAFFAASVVGRLLIEAAERAGFRRIASVTFTLEAILLLCVVAIGSLALIPPGAIEPGMKPTALVYVLLAMLAGAMGLQTVSLSKIGPLTVHTTFLTGMLNKLAQVISLWCFDLYDLYLRHKASEESRLEIRRNTRRAAFFVSIWILYLAGAVCGTWLGRNDQLRSLYLPCALLLIVIAVDQARPLSIEEEQETEE